MTKRLLAACAGIALALCVFAPAALAQSQGMEFQGGYYDDENFEDDWFFDYYDVSQGASAGGFGDEYAYEHIKGSQMQGRQFARGGMQGRGTEGGEYGYGERREDTMRDSRDYAYGGMRGGDYDRSYGRDYGDRWERDTQGSRDYAERSGRGPTHGDTWNREDRGWRDYPSEDMSERRGRGTDYGYDHGDDWNRGARGSQGYAQRGSNYGETWDREDQGPRDYAERSRRGSTYDETRDQDTQGSRDYAERGGRSSTYSDTWNRPDRSDTRAEDQERNMASDDWYSEGFGDEGMNRSRDFASEDDWTTRTDSRTWSENESDRSNF